MKEDWSAKGGSLYAPIHPLVRALGEDDQQMQDLLVQTSDEG